jgi:hypothetical protein
MVDGGVDDEVAFEVVDYLVYRDDPMAIFARLNRDGLHAGIRCSELTCPVGAHCISSMDVEIAISSIENFAFGHAGCVPQVSYSG